MQTDRIDRAILARLAQDGRAAVGDVAQAAGLSQSACSRRIQALESAGLIAGYSARLDRARLGFAVTALVDITLSTQIEEDLAAFERAVAEIDGILFCALVSGQQDYRLVILCRDLADYERIHRDHLGRLPKVNTINSSFVLRQVPTRSEADAMLAHIRPDR